METKAKGILFIEHLQKDHTINGKNYTNLLKLLPKAIKIKNAAKLSKGVLFYQDNEPPP